ncbi:MAG: lipid IV(A) 3-deoxy-D-manno-octulosonic acid transferase [Pseudomonadales bacterium]|nr:lipid IV(A) 3-deoxy-D-manno-octulosonic acid transferase [Pseudomonadales bacterium]
MTKKLAVNYPLRAIYSCIFYLLTPVMLFKLWLRGRKSPAYRQRIGERFGFASKVSDTAPLWVHAVSVGECVAIAPLLKQLLAQYPQLSILVTTSTPTGADRVAKLFASYQQVWHQYCPYDQPGSVARFLRSHKPLGLLIVETELWPNMLAQCSSNNIPVLLANARMSDKSARGYAKVGRLTAQMLQHLNLLVAQYPSDGERFLQLGLAAEKLLISGSIKFDLQIADRTLPEAAQLRQQIGSRAVLILGSSHKTEEQGVLELLAELWQQFPELLLIIVPRHPERFEEVASLARKYSDKVVRRSAGAFDPQCQIYIGDTMGELAMLYAVADLAIVGGSFVAVGGQSPLEPASVAKGVLMGPQQYNFSVICPQLEAAQGMYSCSDYRQLLQQLQRLLAAPQLMQEMGVRAEKYFLSQRGATTILLQQIQSLLLKK